MTYRILFGECVGFLSEVTEFYFPVVPCLMFSRKFGHDQKPTQPWSKASLRTSIWDLRKREKGIILMLPRVTTEIPTRRSKISLPCKQKSLRVATKSLFWRNKNAQLSPPSPWQNSIKKSLREWKPLLGYTPIIMQEMRSKFLGNEVQFLGKWDSHSLEVKFRY